MISWWEPHIGVQEGKLIKEVLETNYINEGKYTSRFEKTISGLLGVDYVISATNGTSALFLAIAGLGIGAGDEVIIPDLTFVATANAVKLAGANPVLADIDPKTLMLSLESVKELVTSKTKAIIPVHISGRGLLTQELMNFCNKNSLFIIEDAAEAFMSKKDGKYLGTIGDAGMFSLSPNKIITTGQGGIIVVKNESVYYRIKELKDQGREKQGTGGADIHNAIGYNFKFTNLQAAIGLGQLEYLNKRIERAIKTYRIYKENLEEIDEIHIFNFDYENGEFPLWVDCLAENRPELDTFLRKNSIHCREFWRPVHTQKPYLVKNSENSFKNVLSVSEKALWLPSSFKLKDADVYFVCDKIKEFYKG